MKMTRMEWRYLQRIALNHPYFDTHKLPLTEKEAKAIVEANIKMTGREFVDSIYAKLGMTRPEEKKDRFAWLHNIGELFTVPPIRKIAIAVLVVVLMAVFFTATPAGRAIAESVIRYIVTLFDDGQLAINRNDNNTALVSIDTEEVTGEGEQDEYDDVMAYVYLESFDDFTRITGKKPVTLPLPYTRLYYYWEADIDYCVLNTTYNTPKGKITASQTWNAEDLVSTTLTGFMQYDSNETIYYSIEENGKIIVNCIFEDSVFGISVQGDYTLDELIGMLQK